MYGLDEEHTSFITDRGLYRCKVYTVWVKKHRTTYQQQVDMVYMSGNSVEFYVDNMSLKSK